MSMATTSTIIMVLELELSSSLPVLPRGFPGPAGAPVGELWVGRELSGLLDGILDGEGVGELLEGTIDGALVDGAAVGRSLWWVGETVGENVWPGCVGAWVDGAEVGLLEVGLLEIGALVGLLEAGALVGLLEAGALVGLLETKPRAEGAAETDPPGVGDWVTELPLLQPTVRAKPPSRPL